MSYGAYVPDLPGCVAVGETKAEVCGLIREAIGLYLEALEVEGQPVPTPKAHEIIEDSTDLTRTAATVATSQVHRWQRSSAWPKDRRTRIVERITEVDGLHFTRASRCGVARPGSSEDPRGR